VERFVALLRAVNLGSHNKLPMAELRILCAEIGWSKVQTYIQSGNIVFEAFGNAPELEAQLEAAIAGRFSIETPVMVRSATAWGKLRGSNPFLEAAEAEPNRLMLLTSKRPPAPGAAEAIQERARDGEKVASSGGAIWIHYPGGSGTSRLSPALVDRLVGSPATARNYRTVVKLDEMLTE